MPEVMNRWQRYRARHPERVRDQARKYRARPEVRKKVKRWQRTADAKRNPVRRTEQSRLAMRKWRMHPANKEKARVYSRRYLQKKKGMPAPTRPEPQHCEACGAAPKMPFTHLALDHCHTTGKFRGWLCNSCNRGLGWLGDNLAGVLRIVVYLGGTPWPE